MIFLVWRKCINADIQSHIFTRWHVFNSNIKCKNKFISVFINTRTTKRLVWPPLELRNVQFNPHYNLLSIYLNINLSFSIQHFQLLTCIVKWYAKKIIVLRVTIKSLILKYLQWGQNDLFVVMFLDLKKKNLWHV